MQNKLLMDKDEEFEKLKRDHKMLERNNAQETNERRNLELEVNSLSQARANADKESNSITLLNDRLQSERIDLERRAKDAQHEISTLLKRIEETGNRLKLVRQRAVQKEAELDSEARSRQLNNDQAADSSSLNTKFEDENKELLMKVVELENAVVKKQQQYNNSTTILDVRRKELDNATSALTYSESKSVLLQEEFEQARRNNDTLQRLLDQYRQDVDFQENLREIEGAKKVELEAEKRRLEQEAISKDIETCTARRELEQVKGRHEELLESNWQIGKELDALKQHAELLQDQNATLNNELESLVEADEVVRKDLDRKARVEYIKSKNNSEVQRSTARVRTSQSPERSPYSSPYKYCLHTLSLIHICRCRRLLTCRSRWSPYH
eukprot:TRINITY_DN1144_c0_g1_i3.p1 TRINITY_DN1144_c0_g1~~TRINITY_DN1144_c0_g1_i3.p1  ORF type:complete len:383 (+),score=94.79 TRINITY_DN1144_c0_g1_i3:398-1546(+)